MAIGTRRELESFNYPNAYPHGAYVLWTLQMDNSSTFGNTVFRISFGHIHLYYDNVLSIGSGWDPDDSQSLIEYYDSYYGYPDDLITSHAQIFVEIDARRRYYDHDYFYAGIQLDIILQNISSKPNNSILHNDHQQ